MIAAKKKSISPPGLSALWTILLLVVALFLPETRVWGFAATPQPASGVFAPANPLSIGENYDGWQYDASDSSLAARGIPTPHGIANQANTPAARAALGEVQSGATVYRQGSFGVQNTADAQFWSLQNPAGTRGFANQMGMPGGAAKPDWIMGGTVSPGAPVITRPAPGIGANAGGSMEAVVPSGGVRNLWFHMPD